MKKMIRIPLVHGSARVEEGVSKETVASLNKMVELVYNMTSKEIEALEVCQKCGHKGRASICSEPMCKWNFNETQII